MHRRSCSPPSTSVHASPSRRLALTLSLFLTLAACSAADEVRGVASDRRATGTVANDRAIDHAALDTLPSLLDLPRAEVRITPGQGRGDRGGGVAGGREVRLLAAIAADDVARARGLQGVTELPRGAGMLFLFPGPAGPGGRPGFWMRDTLVPLDIVFAVTDVDGGAARDDGVAIVVAVATMVPCPAMPCPVTHPGLDYDVALEVAAGWLAATGVGPGDVVRWMPASRP